MWPRQVREYPYTLLFFASMLVAILLYISGTLHRFAELLQPLSYIGILINGFFFSSAFTSSTATLLFIELGEKVNPLLAAPVGGIGATIADTFLYRLLKNHLLKEMKHLALSIHRHIHPNHRLFFSRSKKFRPFLFLLGGIVISSPFPDELGVALFTLANVRFRYFSLVVFICNTIGIAILLSLGH